MDRSRSRRQVLILDCCHSGAFAHGAKGAIGAGVGTAAAFEGTGFGRMVLTATDATQFAWEGDRVVGEADNSVFTRWLVEGLRTGRADADGDGQITLDELYDYVYEQVVKATPRQTPRKFTYNQQGDVVIARNPCPVAQPAALPAELRLALDSPLSGVREGAVRELERLLHGGHRGLSLAAREALQGLAHDDSRRVSMAAEAALAAMPPTVRPTVERPQPAPVEPMPAAVAAAAPDPAGAEPPAPAATAKPVAAQPSSPVADARPQRPMLPLSLASSPPFRFWLALLVAVGGWTFSSALYIPMTQAGWPSGAHDLVGGAISGLAVGLSLWLVGALPWEWVLALPVIWAVPGYIGGVLIGRLDNTIDTVTAWLYGLALIGALRGAFLAALLARRFRCSPFAPPLLVVTAGWILGTEVPMLVISRTPFWVTPTLFSSALWGALESAIGSGVTLWQVRGLEGAEWLQ